MKLSDTASGLLTLVAGLAVVGHAWTFPPMPGQPVGPSLFPIVVGSALALFGAVLAFTGAVGPAGPWIAFDDWVRKPGMVLNFALVIGVVVFYAVAVDRLGFFITACAFLSVLFLAFGVSRRWIAPVALAVTIVIHYSFYTLLRVPLPWGVLGGIAW
jgi:putative tricarboxylic transport membrane protein